MAEGKAELIHVDLSQEMEDWRSALYGKEVRAAQISALTKTQTQMNLAVDYIGQKGDDITATKENADNILAKATEINTTAEEHMKQAEAWAHGRTDHPDQSEDNAEYWSNQSKASATASDKSAKASESWAVGGTGTRDGENTDNSKYWSGQSQTQADRAKNEADRASQYSTIVSPDFYLDEETMQLCEKGGKGVAFGVYDGVLAWKIA